MHTRVNTGKTMGLDNMIWRAIIITSLIPAAVLGYSLTYKKECPAVSFTIKSLLASADTIYYTESPIFFKANIDENDISWNFGDKSDLAFGQFVDHQFKSEGEYFISAKRSLGCETTQKIYVKNSDEFKNSPEFVTGGEIIGPITTNVGKPEMFTCMIKADKYEWSVPNMPEMTQTGQTAKFKFPLKGKTTIQVTLNGDRTKRYEKDVLVENAIPEPEKIKPKKLIPDEIGAVNTTPTSVVISEATFVTYMQKVVDGEYTVDDFDPYLCAGGTTPVILKGNKKDAKKFSWVCEQLKNKKRTKNIFQKVKIKIKAVRVHRDADKCVTLLEIDY